MNCIKIAMLVTLIVPLALRGASLQSNVVVTVAPSPEQQQPPLGCSKNGASSAPGQADHQHWSRQQYRKDQSRHAAFTRQRFGTGGGDGGGGGFFSDDKRFSPTGSNPLHNL